MTTLDQGSASSGLVSELDGVPLLKISGLSIRYHGSSAWVLDGVSVNQLSGRITAIIGPSGCGKTSLIHAACGLIPHCIPADYRGRISLGPDGVEIAHASVRQIASQVAYVGQNPDSAVVTRSVFDEVCFALQNLCLEPAEIEARAQAALQQVGLDQRLWDDPWTLSGGQRQRLSLAAALAMSPQLLILDEPTSTIDIAGRKDFYQRLAPLVSDGLGVIVIDHDLDPILPLVDQVIAIGASGQVLTSGTPRQVYLEHRATLAAEGIWIPRGASPATGTLTCEEAGIHLPSLEQWGGREVRYHERQSDDWQPVTTFAEPSDQARLELVDFSVPGRAPAITAKLGPGELVALIGPNGAGKSSLLAALAGIGPFQAVRAEVAGKPLRRGAHRIGYVFQNPEHQFVANTVASELAFGGIDQARVSQLLDQFQLQPQSAAHPLTLSGGQSRRLSVATMVGQDREIIALDEPTFGQDWANTEELMSFVEQLRQAGKTVLMATHDLELASRWATKIIALPLDEPPPNSSAARPVPNSSFLGKLHPFTLFAAIIAPAVACLALRSLTFSLAVMGLTGLVIAVSRAGWRRVLGSLGVQWGLAALLAWASANITSPEMYARVEMLAPGVATGANVGALLGLALVSGIATDPSGIVRGATQVLHLPYRVGAAGVAALAFLSRFRQDFQLLRTARALRGVGKGWGFLAPVVRWITSLVPLMITAIGHGERVAMSMDARAFGAYSMRTELQQEFWRWWDTAVILLVWTVTVLAWRFSG